MLEYFSSIDHIIKISILLVIVVYIFFTAVIYNEISSMKRLILVPTHNIVQTISLGMLIVGIMLFILGIAIL